MDKLQDQQIVKARIHPGIGVARVGNSAEEYFLGPEVPFPSFEAPGFYKDATGAIKRQAARFRIYGYNAAGEVVREIKAADAEIRWHVHVANKKAAWYEFYGAMDIPTAKPTPLRNANYTGAARQGLVIDPGRRGIQGMSEQGPEYELRGKFLGAEVYLGELRTDEEGRLIFLGGRGVSDSPFPNNPLPTYADNPGWYDDISDGPVTANVKLRGERSEIPVDPAWVVTAPPNFAPDIISFQTLHDVMFDTWATNYVTPAAKPSFMDDILPLLLQLSDLQWVNYGFFLLFGTSAPNDFLRNEYFAQLADPSPASSETRALIFRQFRNPAFVHPENHAWPPIWGDAAFTKDPRQNMAITNTLYGYLLQWAEGNFTDDFPRGLLNQLSMKLDFYPIAKQPNLLDRAPLHFCAGGPFHPGCEMTWIMRHLSLYREAYRIRPRGENDPEPDYGPLLDPATVNHFNGPLNAQGPGDLTRWMAVPWQGDSAGCRNGYYPLGQEVPFSEGKDSFLPTFWPARVPNHVLTEADYETVMDTTQPLEARLQAFRTRAVWLRGLQGEYLQQTNQMVHDFGKLGIIERRPGPIDQPNIFPQLMFVESTPGFAAIEQVPKERNARVGKPGRPLGKVARAALIQDLP
ncbi:MAG: LodA/GoxA family CTQ-dependent oxidase [Bryobacteraceae bacterium]|nr:LodA/GoxA family CTQ-dependent oxidase [Bryobacteraceae bacterium]